MSFKQDTLYFYFTTCMILSTFTKTYQKNEGFKANIKSYIPLETAAIFFLQTYF